MAIPESLGAKIELFENCGRVALLEDEHFAEESWLSVLLGQGVQPNGHDPLADVMEIDEVKSRLTYIRQRMHEAVDTLPAHRTFLEQQRSTGSELAP
jgi:tryptophan 7-halogenase